MASLGRSSRNNIILALIGALGTAAVVAIAPSALASTSRSIWYVPLLAFAMIGLGGLSGTWRREAQGEFIPEVVVPAVCSLVLVGYMFAVLELGVIVASVLSGVASLAALSRLSAGKRATPGHYVAVALCGVVLWVLFGWLVQVYTPNARFL